MVRSHTDLGRPAVGAGARSHTERWPGPGTAGGMLRSHTDRWPGGWGAGGRVRSHTECPPSVGGIRRSSPPSWLAPGMRRSSPLSVLPPGRRRSSPPSLLAPGRRRSSPPSWLTGADWTLRSQSDSWPATGGRRRSSSLTGSPAIAGICSRPSWHKMPEVIATISPRSALFTRLRSPGAAGALRRAYRCAVRAPC